MSDGDVVIAGSSPLYATMDLCALTPARVGLSRSGVSLSTQGMLAFARDHARARDAVHTAFDADRIVADIAALGLTSCKVQSQAPNRAEYLRRPDLGRLLDHPSGETIEGFPATHCDIAVVVGDGLSSAAAHGHALPLLRDLLPRLNGLVIGPAIVASGARVALGDDIGARLHARLMLMLIGERPGLTTPDSLGAYVTYAPRVGLTDADRNCVSNVHRGGLDYAQAGGKIAWLVREALTRGITGIALKDDSGLLAAPNCNAAMAVPVD